MYSLIWRTQSFQLTDEDWTHHAVICLFWAKWRLDKNAASWCCSGWCYFDADKSWHCVHLFSKSRANISQASSLCSRFLSLHPVCYTKKDLQPASIVTHHQLLSNASMIENIEPLVVIFFNSCQSCLVHHRTFTLLPRATRLTPHVSKEPGAWGGITTLLWSGAIKEERPVELGWWG